MPARLVPMVRIRSPARGSTLTTSAPWSASTIVVRGPDMLVVRSTTRMPRSGWVAVGPRSGRSTVANLTAVSALPVVTLRSRQAEQPHR
jgi:hypothetical protein